MGGAFVYRAGQHGCFKQIQDLNPYKNDKGTLGVVSSFVAVTAARTVVMPFNYPFDYARIRLASDVKKGKGQFNGIADCIMTTVRQQGVVGLYTGWSVTAARTVVMPFNYPFDTVRRRMMLQSEKPKAD